MRFNVNNEVRIKLTERGRNLLRANHTALFKDLPFAPPHEPPIEDQDGWSTWQLWQLMMQFGPHIWNGAPVPFETEIEIPEAASPPASPSAPPPPDQSQASEPK